MFGHIFNSLFRRREGIIVVVASGTYFIVGSLARYAPSAIPVAGFYAWFFQFMPIPLLLCYQKIGGFKKVFESSTFTTAMIVFTAMVPAIVKLRSLFNT